MTRSSIVYQSFEGNSDEWHRLVTTYDDACLLQTWEFGEAKSKLGPWRVERGILLENEVCVGAVQTMIREVPFFNAGLAWINRGPVGPIQDYGKALRALEHYFCGERGFYLRIAPSRPFKSLPELEWEASGLSKTGISGWASAVVNLLESEEALRKKLHSKWRNALVSAERLELEIREDRNKYAFQTFLKGHSEHITSRGPGSGLKTEFLTLLEDLLPVDRRPLCIAAYKDGDYLGGALITQYGKTAEYLAGHNTLKGRVMHAGQSILWAAITYLKANGVDKFDLGGMDEKLTPPGIFRFKKRIGANPYRLMDEMEGFGPGLINKIVRWRVMSEKRRISGVNFD